MVNMLTLTRASALVQGVSKRRHDSRAGIRPIMKVIVDREQVVRGSRPREVRDEFVRRSEGKRRPPMLV